MTMIVCVDDHNGLLFNMRRQSRDREVIARVLARCEGKRLWVSPYSAPLFGDADVAVDDDPAAAVQSDDCCFIENTPLMFDKATRLIVYRWNRHYPSDVRLPDTPEALGFTHSETAEFAGHSHECITEDIYTK